ncbi:porin family protein [Leadbetterella sp. DM7]|uniref:porin family protein n=1 Tax=Leadbetterella sp. DM7 TaxID=3235085 RepID=UPI00349EA7DF
MKISTKSVLILFFLCAALASSAQTYRAKAGVNLSSMLLKNNSGRLTDNVKIHPGIHLGVTAEFPIKDNISFETGLLFSTKGLTEERNGMSRKVSTYYLDIPLTGRIIHEWNSHTFYGVFGPYLGIGLSGKEKYSGWGQESDYKIKWGAGKSDHYKRLEAGLIIGAGIVFDPIEIGLQYNIGLSNMSSYTGEGQKVANRVFAITAAYKLER